MTKKNRRFSWSVFVASFKFLNFSYLQKWTSFGIMIGIIGGLSAIGLSTLTSFLTSLLLGGGAGFIPPSPGIQQGTYTFVIERPWMFPILGSVGGLAVGLLFYKFASERPAQGGVDAVINAFHNNEGNIKGRTSVLEGIATPVTLGSGGSGGTEGPIALIVAGISSVIARTFKFDADDRRIALATGMAAGIGSIYKIPIGAALFSAQVFYRRDLEIKVIIPSVIAAIVGYVIYGVVFGWEPIFLVHQGADKFGQPNSLLLYAIIGIISAAVSMAYVRIFRLVSATFSNMKKVPKYARPAIGGAIVGMIATIAPQVMGSGYGWLQIGMLENPLFIPIWIVLAIVVLKIVATSFTIGSGGIAGLFAPTIVIGGLLGIFVVDIFHTLGFFLDVEISVAAIVGMTAFFGATTKAPIASTIIGIELTRSYYLLLPIIIATAISYFASSLKSTIFNSQVTSRGESPSNRKS